MLDLLPGILSIVVSHKPGWPGYETAISSDNGSGNEFIPKPTFNACARAAEDSARRIMGAKRYLLDSINITLIFASLQWLQSDIEGTVLLNKRERTWVGSFTCLRNPNIERIEGKE